MLRDRLLRIEVRDKDNNSLDGADIEVSCGGVQIADMTGARSTVTLQINDPDASIEINLRYQNYIDHVKLSSDANEYVFMVPVRQHIGISPVAPLAFGSILLSVSIFLAFWFSNPTPVQVKIIIACLSVSLAGIGSSVPGFLKVDLTIKNYITITAAGAMGIFVILFFATPGT